MKSQRIPHDYSHSKHLHANRPHADYLRRGGDADSLGRRKPIAAQRPLPQGISIVQHLWTAPHPGESRGHFAVSMPERLIGPPNDPAGLRQRPRQAMVAGGLPVLTDIPAKAGSFGRRMSIHSATVLVAGPKSMDARLRGNDGIGASGAVAVAVGFGFGFGFGF